MALLRRTIRSLVVALLLLAVGLPAGIYLVLATPWAQNELRGVAERELTKLLGTEVNIGRVDYEPFNTLAVSTITVDDDNHRTALGIGRLMARFELLHFLRTGRLNFDYVLIDAPEVHLSRANASAPLNIQPILDRLKPKDRNKPPTEFDIKVGTVSLRNGLFTYDVLSDPVRPGGLDVSHVRVSDLNMHAYLRQASRQSVAVDLEALSFSERCGMILSDLSANVRIVPDSISVSDLILKLPDSRLQLAAISVPTAGMGRIQPDSLKLKVATSGPARISTDDLTWVWPYFSKIHRVVNLELDVEASRRSISVARLSASDNKGLEVKLSGTASDIDNPQRMSVDARIDHLSVPQSELTDILGKFTQKNNDIATCAGSVKAKGTVAGNLRDFEVKLNAATASGTVDIDAEGHTPDKFKHLKFNASVNGTDVELGTILGTKDLGNATFAVTADGTLADRNIEGTASLRIASVTALGHLYRDIAVDASRHSDVITVDASSHDPDATFDISASGSVENAEKSIDLYADIVSFNPARLNIKLPRPGLQGSMRLRASLAGSNADNMEGSIQIDRLRLKDTAINDSISINRFDITALRHTHPQQITVQSDVLNGTVEGVITPSTLPAIFTDMARRIVPALLPPASEESDFTERPNDFKLNLTVDNALHLSQFLKLPVLLIHPVDIHGEVSSTRGVATLTIDAPYLQQGDKIIDKTVVEARTDRATDRAYLYASTHMPTKKGPMTAVFGVNASNNQIDTKVDWNIDRKIPLKGKINFLTALSRREGALCVRTKLYPGQINFGDDVWQIEPSNIEWCDGRLDIDHFALQADDQRVAIDGVASASADDVVTIDLTKINLVSIFENLEIENALLVGRATGTFTASQALSKVPLLQTDGLHVDGIGYNYCVLGDGDLKAHWDNELQAFWLDADVVNPEGQYSRIYGTICPAKSSLDLHFDAKHIKVGFMQPFMKAFASDISGYASGKAHLFGPFSNIDLEGDILAENLRLKINFTNTYYTATDSIHMRPGLIELPDITLYDVNGHTAKLNGRLTHEFFRQPSFDFRVSDARDFLSYNVSPGGEQPWYGTIYGNGGVSIVGKPGVINIGVDMATAAGSSFTFILSDRLEAAQYSFITFNDATKYSEEEILQTVSDLPEAVRRVLEKPVQTSQDAPSNYIMDLNVDITPQARINLIMDPVGGDNIRANGTGDLRLYYNANENDLKMFGKYTLDKGNYNFTLQDIIIKDFAINPGGTITFRGDPYSAQLDIEAVYQLNANLSDLDESFTQDKDLNRTNVPVHAILKVSGDIRQPDIAFDLAFPTLTSDTYRKVRSIISTDDMMNRQMLYLLALNRFYTPDYMASTGKGSSELFSVASSTLSSQLSSLLGKLSDNWSIAPNLRSDRGDFSDMEVDVMLSSRLLNNRLLFNGNFGYRDKSLNNNQFIGDFDVKYLINPKGTLQLKAFNRYNDQNYYVRTAATTQGLGVVFRRDFDNLLRHRPDTVQCPHSRPDTLNKQ